MFNYIKGKFFNKYKAIDAKLNILDDKVEMLDLDQNYSNETQLELIDRLDRIESILAKKNKPKAKPKAKTPVSKKTPRLKP